MLLISKFFMIKTYLKKNHRQVEDYFNLFPNQDNKEKLEFLRKYFLDKDKSYIDNYLKINQKITPIINTLQGIESSIDNFQSQQQDRLFTLEERAKSISKISAPNGEDDEKRIVQMYSEGKSVESIAKELCVGVGKVELTLKLRELI